ncbi:MAG: NAD(P)/FAD-dependent oxidoreductase [Acidimicrobiia bacterium]|nr:NAD(P)/FAD-dependent oxidoreductase [Acidimicrobiia bacterium]MDH4307490.1 NAD(P)/FAD-dependent oxidoreductase [Acidimicrobiia bacterium]
MTDRPWSRDIPDGPWDYIVIGSGMGGMTAAAILAKLGRRVLVLEQHYIPGGFTQTFKRPGYRWDVGVHLVGEMSTKSFPGRLLHDLTGGLLRWAWLGDVYDEFNFPDGFTIQFPSSIEGFRDTLAEYFPDERKAIDEYIHLVRGASRATSGYLRSRPLPWPLGGGKAEAAALPHITATTAEVLRRLTSDPRLQSVLAAQWGYYGSTPSKSSFAMHALMVQHFIRGAYYPEGGAGRIAETMLATVSQSGGWTAVRRSVESITTRGDTAVGVRLDDGTTIGARRVISTVGAPPTARLLPEGTLPTIRHEPGPAHVSLYLGFEGDVERAGATKYSQWFFDSWDMEVDGWNVAPGSVTGQPPVLFNSFPSIKDPLHGSDDRHTGEAVTFVPWESFSTWSESRWQKRGGAYDSFKDQLTQVMLDQYQELYPELGPMIRHAELSTPVTTHHFARSAKGSIYGLVSEPERFLDPGLQPKTPVKGLYLGGVDAMAPGVTGAMGGGLIAALAAEPVRVGRYLRPLMKR